MNYFDAPVFLVGSERSGTTLLRLMLDSHPDIAFNKESEYLVTKISDDGVCPNVEEYKTWLLGNRVFKHSNFHIGNENDFPALVKGFLKQKKERDNKSIVGATVHYQFKKLLYVWPDAKFIYLLRDGRDVAASVVNMGWAGSAYIGADLWLEAEREWKEVREFLRDDQWIEVRYEDLTESPADVLSLICDFIGTSYSEKMFDYVNNSTYSKPDASLNYQWRRRMEKTQLSMLEGKIGDQLSGRGYDLSGTPTIKLGKVMNYYMYLLSRINNILFRFDKYGVGLVFKEFIFRKLGFSEWHKKSQQEIDRIIDLNIR